MPCAVQPVAGDAGDPLPVRAHLEGRSRWRRPARCRARRHEATAAAAAARAAAAAGASSYSTRTRMRSLCTSSPAPGLNRKRVEQQPLLHLPAVHVLARELRRHRRVEGVGPVGRLVPAEHLRHLAVRTRLVHRRRVDPVARQHAAGLVQHLEARLLAGRHVQQYPLQRQLRQPRLQRVAVHVGRNAQPLEALAADRNRRHVEALASPARGSPRGRPRRAPARPHPPPARCRPRPSTPGSSSPPRPGSRPRPCPASAGACRARTPARWPPRPRRCPGRHRPPPGSIRTPAPSRPAARPRPSPRTPDRAASPLPLRPRPPACSSTASRG